MSVAKCHNYTGCLLAYRGEAIPVPADGKMLCPECKKPLTRVRPGVKAFITVLIWVTVLGLIGFGVKSGALQKYFTAQATPAPKTGPTPVVTTSTPKTVAKSATTAPATPDVQAPEPPENVSRPEHIDTNIENAENKRTREEVLRRIDLMPNVSVASKDKLYASVERARSMGLVLTIPFGSGKVVLSPMNIQQLTNELIRPDVAKLRDDPTSIFVILGYADPKGDEKKNLDISQKRADIVLEAMRDKCGVANVMHSVAMGGQKLVDEHNLEKDRVAEVWVVLP